MGLLIAIVLFVVFLLVTSWLGLGDDPGSKMRSPPGHDSARRALVLVAVSQLLALGVWFSATAVILNSNRPGAWSRVARPA